jgi:hypothetical protein
MTETQKSSNSAMMRHRFCPALLNELDFEPATLQPCCGMRVADIPTFAYPGGKVDIPAYQEHIQQTFDALQSAETLCRGCRRLQDVEGNVPADIGKRVRFHTISINHHRFICNCRCVYCSLWQMKEKPRPYDILLALKSLAAQSALHPNCSVSWGGGGVHPVA